jgi:3-hydroxybutyryl-CoA dehydrogenase
VLLEKTAVIGAGLMGGQIALVLAMGSRQTFLADTEQKIIDDSFRNIERYASDLYHHDLLGEDPSKVVDRIETTTSLREAAADAELVVEAVFEDLEVKKDVFRKLDEVTQPHAILSSNTSGFPISKIAAATKNPDRVVGAHFVQPAHIVPIVEVVKGEKTSDDVMKRSREMWLGLHRIPIVVNKDISGFILNRIQHAMIREAVFLVAEGVAQPEDIDLVVSLGLAPRLTVSGPLEQRDINGIDLNYRIAQHLWSQLSGSEEPLQFLKQKVEKGELGLKSGRGYYDWSGMRPNEVRSARDEALLQITKEVLRHMEGIPRGMRN